MKKTVFKKYIETIEDGLAPINFDILKGKTYDKRFTEDIADIKVGF